MTMTDYVLGAVRARILTGRYGLGTKLDQQSLAEELGTSIIPVRESLRCLEAEGLVRIYPRRGAYVAELSVGELEELYLIRQTLEALATRLAVPLLSGADLQNLGRIVAQMERATQQHHFSELLDLNRTFHFAIYAAAQRPLLCQTIEGLWGRSALYRSLYTYLPERAPVALAEHQAILRACLAGDADGAAAAVHQNVAQTVEGMLQRLQHADQSAASRPPEHQTL